MKPVRTATGAARAAGGERAKAPRKPAAGATAPRAGTGRPEKTAAKGPAPRRPAKAAATKRPSQAPVLPVRPIVPPVPPRPPPLDRSAPAHAGVREVDWNRFAALARDLAGRIAARFEPDLVVGLAKGGVFAGEELARALGKPFHAVRIGKRSRDGAGGRGGPMPAGVHGRRVLVVDDVAGTGAAIGAAVARAEAAGAAQVRSAAVVARPSGFRPHFAALETEDLVVLPWDLEPPSGAVGMPGHEVPGL